MTDFRPPTDSVALSEMLDVMEKQGASGSELIAARQSIESFVTALIEENERLRERTLTKTEATIACIELEQIMWSSNQIIPEDYGPLVEKLHSLWSPQRTRK